MEVHVGNESKTEARKYPCGYALAILVALAWIAAPVVAQEGGAFAGPESVPEIFEGSLSDQQADAGAGALGRASGLQEVDITVLPGHSGPSEPDFQPGTWDAALDEGTGELALSPLQWLTPNPSFEGINANQTGFVPPDTQGDVGPNHYIQVVNSSFQIWDKNGTSLVGPTTIQTLWAGASNAQAACRDTNSGDPITVYDHLADRWLITKFTRPHFTPAGDPDWQCIAVSRGPDPVNDGWYLYQFAMIDESGADFSHDYPKFGVWPDGYYMGSQEGFYGGDLNLMVFDRANMLNGNPAGTQSLDGGNQTFFWLPADLDGPPPPAGTPNYFARQVDSDHYGVGGSDRIEIVEFHVDWQNPANTGFSASQSIAVLPFEETLCGGGDPGLFQNCIPQPTSAILLEGLTVWPMYRLQYRNFGNRDTLVFNHTVNADGNGTAGVRWYELERATPGNGPWTLRQQGTYSPQNPGNAEPEHRWMGSVAMDRFGNMALGYSVSSVNLVANGDAVNGYPSIRYTGREADAPLGLMPEVEVTMAQGTQSTASATRWGDYSAMVVDPVDDCTFWYTQQYLTLGGDTWSTRIGAFSFADCNADIRVTKSASPNPATAGLQLTYNINVFNAGILDATNVIVTDTLPAGFSYVADSVPGAECIDTTEPTIVCNFGDIAKNSSKSFTITVLIDSAILQVPDGPTAYENLVEADAEQPDNNLGNNSFALSTLVNELADLAVTKTCKPDRDAVVGEVDAYCEIFVTNNGPSLARNVTLVDEITASGVYTIGAIVIDPATGRSCNEVSGDVECDLADIDAGETVKVTVHVSTLLAIDVNDTATVATDTPESDYGNNTATGQIHFVLSSADVRVTKQCEPNNLFALTGTDAFCEIFVFNNGPSPAVNVVLTDEIASDGTYTVQSATTSAGTCTPLVPTDDVDVECLLGTIAVGATVKVTAVFTSLEEVDVEDIATATSDTSDPDPNNNTATGSVTFKAVADLSITKTDNPPSVDAGTVLTYTINVANAGPSTAVNVVVSDILPVQTEFVSYTVTVGSGSCVAGVAGDSSRPTQCGLGDIVSGGAATIVVVVNVLPDAKGLIHNDVSISSDTFDDDNSDNQVTEDTTVLVNTELVLTKTDSPDPVAAGAELKYVLSLTNNGPSTATDVILVDSLPAETSLVNIKVLGGVGDCLLSQSSPDIVTCTLNDMNPLESFMVGITVLVDPSVADGTSIHNDAVVAESSGPGANASADTLVNAEADLWIDKTGYFITENPSKTIRYVLTVHNDSGCSGDDPQVCGDGGPSDAQGVVVIDDLPADSKKLVVTFVSEDCVYNKGPHTVTCTMQTPLAAGDSVFFEIEAQPRGKLGAIINTADVSSSTSDPNSGNNTDDMLIKVSGGGQK
jgi:uncharacterized repeat protein (TIGR01451 family)